MKDIYKLVVTGGPCGGKSTALEWIEKAFTAKGYTVIFVAETATELINAGVAPWDFDANKDFQKCLARLQWEKEKVFYRAAKRMNAGKVLIVCDRGEADNMAYMTRQEYLEVLDSIGSNEEAVMDKYDAVFHLVTAAKGAEEYYTTANNTARTETAEQAAALDDRFIEAWTGHSHFRVIDNSTDFNGKMERLIDAIAAFLEKENG